MKTPSRLIILLAGLVLFTQLGEILDQKDFWNNFSSSQA